MYLYFQAAVGNATEVARGPRTAAVSDGGLHFQQEVHDRCSIRNQGKFANYFSTYNGEMVSLTFRYGHSQVQI